MVRLAAGLGPDKHLTPEAMERAMACLTRFGQLVRDLPRGSVRVVGTNTLRSARNSVELIDHAERVLGHPVEIISGVEEARLIYLGVAHSLPDPGGRRLVVDIGGGSTEVILGEGFEPVHMESLHMGCVAFTRRFFPDGAISLRRLQQARLAALLEMEPIIATYRQQGWEQAIGASGTIRAVHKVVQGLGLCRDGISAAALSQLVERLADFRHHDELDLPGLSEARAPVFVGGVMVLLGVFEGLRIRHMTVSDGALREGLLYDLLGRIRDEDVRERTVESLARRYQASPHQARRVSETVARLLAQARDPWRLDDDNLARLLTWAARLHEIGMDIAHTAYHKHGAYILRHADMPGFSRSEQTVMATLVRAHRRKFPAGDIEALPDTWRKPLTRLAILLRLAVVLHRARSHTPLPELHLAVKKKTLRLRFPEGWLAEHPLTAADLEQEADYLEKIGYRLEFG